MAAPQPQTSSGPFARFGVDPNTTARVLSRALSRGGDFSDIFFEQTALQALALDDGALRTATSSLTVGAGIRVVKGEATGLAYTEDLSLKGLLAAAETAASVASGSQQDVAISVDRPATPLNLYARKESASVLDTAERVQLLRRADEAARAFDARVSNVQVSYAESERNILVVSSDGRYASDTQPMLRFNVAVIAADGDRRQTATEGGGGRLGFEYFDDHSPEDAARAAARSATVMLDAREAPAGEFPVVLGPGDSGILLHEAVGHGLEADFNRKGTSNYSGATGEAVAASGCTVVDDGTIAGSRGSINIDDEGNAPQRNVLIEDGILRGYMHDQMSTDHFSVGPSGNGRRQDFRSLPLPRMTNTYMLPGEHDPDEIIASVQRGIYARSFSGGQVNISNGDFVFSVTEGYLIEDGKLTAPVRGVNLIGNGPDVLRKVSMVGNDFALSDGRWTCGKDGQSVPVGVGIPTVKVDAITVGGSDV